MSNIVASFQKGCPKSWGYITNNKASDSARSKRDIVRIIKELRERIEERNDLIKKVVALRDKAYAHKDPNVISDEIQELVNFASELHNSLNIAIFHTETRFDYTDDWNIDFILFHMNESRIKDHEEYLRKVGKPMGIDAEE